MAITFQAASAIATGQTTVLPAHPTVGGGILAGDILVIVVGCHPDTPTFTTPSGWTSLGAVNGGTGVAAGADVGNSRAHAFYKVAAGGETGTVTVTLSGATSGASGTSVYGAMLCYRNATGTWNVAAATGVDTVANTTWSVAYSSNPGLTSGDHLVLASVISTDTAPTTFTSDAVTATGATIAAPTLVATAASTTGLDIGGRLSRTSVSSGTASASPTHSITLNTGTNYAGPEIMVRLREAAAAPIDLTVANAEHAQTSDEVALVVDLTVADATHAQTADTVSLVVDLVPAAATHAQTSTSPTLVLAGDPGVVPWVRDARHGGTGGTNTAVNHTVPIPTCQVGDDLWASFTLNSGHGAVTEPSGWTRIFPTTITDDTFMTLLIYRKTATATEVAGGNILTVVATAVRGNSGSMAIVGADTSQPPDGVVTATGTSGATSVSQTVVASTDNSLILSILGLDSATEDPTPTAPLVQWWDPVESGVIGQGNAGAVTHRPTAGSASYGWTWTNNVTRKAWAASIRSPVSTSLAVAAATQAQTADNVTLTQVHNLTVDAASQAQTSGNVALTQTHVLTVAEATQAQTADQVALTQVHVLTVAEATQAQTADTPTLTVVVTLTVADASHAQTADNVTLTEFSLLAGSMEPTERAAGTATGSQGAVPAVALTIRPGATATARGRDPAMTPTVRSGTTMTGG